MKLMSCPLNGLRNISEFICGGEVETMPDPVSGNDHDWAEYLFKFQSYYTPLRSHCNFTHQYSVNDGTTLLVKLHFKKNFKEYK